ncbi:EAL domain-containing protein [Noviherbaspirillum sp. CPCC 100848]|uniref:EAL domain-containing protein n=1 Tax=Noviherbaspirillum album TaxID=3080276 RepID=A0ABU6JHG6_9BURK|nr:EAL domain-containing protein [Noviherbaspirillum sp. CPCC 100848]MEC4723094.1 EAL domain-containing protein [Noviherbaspirillum sp. CPCC 100848]
MFASELLSSLSSRWCKFLSKRDHFVHVALIIGAAAFFSVWAMHATRVENERKVALQAAKSSADNIVNIIATNFSALLNRSSLYATIGLDFLLDGDRQIRPYLNPQLVEDGAYVRAALFRADGSLAYSSAKQVSEPELESLVLHAMKIPNIDKHGMLVGQPPVSARYAWRLPILVPLDSGKTPAGYYGAIIDLGYFLTQYRDVELGAGGSVEIMHQDGRVLAVLRDGSLSSLSALRLSGSTLLQRVAPSAGVTDLSLTSVRTLDRHPVLVAVSYDPEIVLKKLEEQHKTYVATSSAVSFLVFLITTGAVFGLKRQQRLYEAMTVSQQENVKLIGLLEKEKLRAMELASHDYLTGIPNRRFFTELATNELKRARRSRNLYALLFLDLDRFKSINDELGHAVGDLLLKAVAARLRDSLRDYDLVARLGGDEFSVLLSEMRSEEHVNQVAAKLANDLSQPYTLDGKLVETSPSIGIALYPRDGQNYQELITHADQAMYIAKKKGQGRFHFYDASLNALAVRESELTSRFKSAIQDNEFCLHYQAKYELDGLRLGGLEALIRWEHPVHGLIFPNDFIPLAEQNDYIIPIGYWVINAVCAQIAKWRANGVPTVPVAINISAQHLRDSQLPRHLIHAIENHGLAPCMIEVEVTESSLIDDTEAAQANLRQLTNAGIRVFLDDFGTGFSNLSWLKQLPISAIKIDRSFVRDLRNDTNDAIIVASMITLAHNLGLIVVAEGVESKDQLVHLKAVGCNHAQGFYLHRPAAPENIESLLQQQVLTV